MEPAVVGPKPASDRKTAARATTKPIKTRRLKKVERAIDVAFITRICDQLFAISLPLRPGESDEVAVSGAALVLDEASVSV